MSGDRLDILAYAVSHHAFEQGARLSEAFDNYRLATFSYFDPATVERFGRCSKALSGVLAKRSHPRLPARQVMDFPSEQIRQITCRLTGKPFSYFRAHDRMAGRLVRRLSPPRALICIDTGAENLFRAWKGETHRIFDLTIGLPQARVKIYDRAREMGETIDFHYPGDWELERYAAEVELADSILCPSDFVRDTCVAGGVPAGKCFIIPYGFDPGLFAPDETWDPAVCRPRCVFIGSFCHRKGSHIVIDLLPELRKRFPELEMHVFGTVIDPPGRAVPGLILHGHVPQEKLAERLRQMHLMIFPSYFEGSAYAIYQALASGVPVITTRNAGSVVDASCGQVLDFPEREAFLEAVTGALANPDRLQEWRAGARSRIAGYTWEAYGRRLVGWMRALMEKVS